MIMEKNYEQAVKEFIDNNNYNLSERLPYNIYRTISAGTGVPRECINYILGKTRAERGITLKIDSNIPFSNINVLGDFCLRRGLIRGSNKEGIVCKTIINQFPQLPGGGHSLLIGTPTPICVFDNSKFGNFIIIDNLQVALALNDASDHLTISVGSGVSKWKAMTKVDLWKRMMPLARANVVMEIVDKNTYARRVENLAKKAMKENTVAKIVLLTSGVWAGSKYSREKYGLDLDFKSPSRDLTSKYPNLHILAMIRTKQSVFEVVYLNNGKQRILSAQAVDILNSK